MLFHLLKSISKYFLGYCLKKKKEKKSDKYDVAL